jgi:hypothetical protein
MMTGKYAESCHSVTATMRDRLNLTEHRREAMPHSVSRLPDWLPPGGNAWVHLLLSRYNPRLGKAYDWKR